MKKTALRVVATLIAGWIGTAQAATDDQKCLAGRAKAKGKYLQCVEKSYSEFFGGGELDQAKLRKCRTKYTATWAKLQKLTGSTLCTLPRFVDNGTTVTDNLTGLIWEKKFALPGDHDVTAGYTWSVNPGTEDGTAFTGFLRNLNALGGFAGANGWRLPTTAELQTLLVSPCTAPPCIDPVFGATQSDAYWSATTDSTYSHFAWTANFGLDISTNGDKQALLYLRAVRAGD